MVLSARLKAVPLHSRSSARPLDARYPPVYHRSIPGGAALERVRFISHRGKRVLLIDHSGSTPEEVLRTMDEVEHVIAGEPADSLLTLSDFTGTVFDKGAADRMKVVAAKDRPHVHRAAIVGAENIPDVYFHNLESFSARHFPKFKTREEALDWLAAEAGQAAS